LDSSYILDASVFKILFPSVEQVFLRKYGNKSLMFPPYD